MKERFLYGAVWGVTANVLLSSLEYCPDLHSLYAKEGQALNVLIYRAVPAGVSCGSTDQTPCASQLGLWDLDK